MKELNSLVTVVSSLSKFPVVKKRDMSRYSIFYSSFAVEEVLGLQFTSQF